MTSQNSYILLENKSDFLFEAKRCQEEEVSLSAYHMKGIRLEGVDLSLFSLRECLLENCIFVNCLFQKCDFQAVTFRSCDISGCDFTESYFSRCCLDTLKAVGTNFTETILRDVDSKDSSFQYANFSSSKIEKTKWTDSDFSHADFPSCKLKNFKVIRVRMAETSFFHTPLAGIDFTSCELRALALSQESTELKGAVVDLYQAAELAKRLGLIIK